MIMDNPEVVAMIPARVGSKRLKMKNLALLNGKPLIYYAIAAAKESGVFKRIFINSDSKVFREIAERYGVSFYHRPSHLGSSSTKSDQIVADFISKKPCDFLTWVNPIAPLQTGKEIESIVGFFFNQQLDTLFTTSNLQVHCNFRSRPLNYSIGDIFAQTQDLDPVQPYVYSIMMWRSKPFMEKIRKRGFGFFAGSVGYYTVNKLSAFIIKDKVDLMIAEHLMRAVNCQEEYIVKYDELVDDRL